MKKRFLIVAALLVLSACSLEKKIDATNEQTMQDSVKYVMKELSAEDQDKFQKALQIIMFDGVTNLMDLAAMGQNMEATKGAFLAKIDGKTGQEIIQMGQDRLKAKQVEKAPSAKEANSDIPQEAKLIDVEKSMADEKADLIENEMKKALEVTLVSKKLISGDYTQNIEIVINFKNMTDKNIRGVKGTAIFKDMFGDLIIKTNISSDETINAGSIFRFKGSRHYNQFDSEDKKMAGVAEDKIEFSFHPSIIIFEDGTKLVAPDTE